MLGGIQESRCAGFVIASAGLMMNQWLICVAAIAWMTFTNMFNHINHTVLDFPDVAEVTTI
jgi:hypothetical protein